MKTMLMLMLIMRNMTYNIIYIVQNLNAFAFNGIAFIVLL